MNDKNYFRKIQQVSSVRNPPDLKGTTALDENVTTQIKIHKFVTVIHYFKIKLSLTLLLI